MEAANNNGYTALMFSAQKGHDSCLRQLLAAKVHSCAMPMTARVNTVRTLESRCGLSQACVCVCLAQTRHRGSCGWMVGPLTVCHIAMRRPTWRQSTTTVSQP